MAAYRCITNNPMLLEKGFSNLEYYETDVLGLCHVILQEVAAGYRLLSHPLTGSIRPDITPYKTVFLSERPGTIDVESTKLMENAVGYAENLYHLRKIPLCKRWDETAKRDFQLVDLSIVEQAMEVAQIRK